MKISLTELEQLVVSALRKQGYQDSEIAVIKEVLLYAQMRGNNQGISKLIGSGIPKNLSATPIRVIKETKLSLALDGGQNMGMLAFSQAADAAVAKAKEHGFGIGSTNNTSSSTGAMGWYVRKATKEGLVAFAFAKSPPFIAPYGSSEATFGTNPLAIGVPTDGDPIVLDMATAGITWFGLVEANTTGTPIPPGIGYDKEGKETTVAGEAMDGSVRTFDKGYKGSGLAFMVEAFAGVLAGASFAGVGKEDNWGNLIFVIDPELLGDRKEVAHNMTVLAAEVRRKKKAPGFERIYTPSEHGDEIVRERIESGEIEVEDKLLEALKVAVL